MFSYKWFADEVINEIDFLTDNLLELQRLRCTIILIS